MKKYTLVNVIMAVVYIPFSFLSFLCGMITEGISPETAPVLAVAYTSFGWIGMFTGFTAHLSLLVSQWFYSQKNNITAGRIFRFLPLMVMVASVVLVLVIEVLMGVY